MSASCVPTSGKLNPIMAGTRPNMLNPPVDVSRDHVLGLPGAAMTLVEYGSYTCPRCHAVHEVIEGLRSRFGERMRYVFRHLPVAGSQDATRASERLSTRPKRADGSGTFTRR